MVFTNLRTLVNMGTGMHWDQGDEKTLFQPLGLWQDLSWGALLSIVYVVAF